MLLATTSFPKEIIWLNGSPGSGKGTNTPFILKARGISAPAIVMSDLLRDPIYQEIIDRGGLISECLHDLIEFNKILKFYSY